ncbi:MAG: hypothetical protein ACM3KD_11950 [Hyphomicrobiaceae bacterium]
MAYRFVDEQPAGYRFVDEESDPLRDVALTGRAAAQGVWNTLSFIPDALIGAQNAAFTGINRLAGTDLPMAEPYSQTFSRALDQAGAYRPETDEEQTASRMIQGMTGAATGVGLGRTLVGGAMDATGRILSTNPGQQITAGLLAPASGEAVRQHGGGPWAQFGAEALTAMMVPSDAAVRSVARARDVPGLLRQSGAGSVAAPAGRAAQGLGEAATEGGRENIVGRILREVSNDPDEAARALQTPPRTISPATTAEAAGDVGLLRAENYVGKTMDKTGRLADRRMEQNAALQGAFDSMVPMTAAESEARRATLNAAAGGRLERVMGNPGGVDVAPIVQRIDDLLASPKGQRQEVRSALEYMRERLLDERLSGGGKVAADPRSLYSVRQDVTDLMNGRLKGAADRAGRELGTTRVSRLARGELDKAVGVLDDAIESVAPGFKDYLKKYASAAQRIDRRRLIGEAREKAATTATDATGENRLLSPAQMMRFVDNRAKEIGTKLNPSQRMRLQSIAADLQRGAKGSTAAVQGRGSDTLSAVAGGATVANVIGRALAGPPTRQGASMAGSLIAKTKLFDWMFGLADQDIHELLVEAMLDPVLAGKLLARANQEAVEEAAQRLRDMATRRASIVSVTRESGLTD